MNLWHGQAVNGEPVRQAAGGAAPAEKQLAAVTHRPRVQPEGVGRQQHPLPVQEAGASHVPGQPATQPREPAEAATPA